MVLLHREGHFPWDAWVSTLAAEIAARPQRDAETAEAAYHRQFLAALETIVAARGIAAPAAVATRAEAWRRAYLNTPHGMAVDLAAADLHHDDDDDHDDDHDHEHHHHGLAPQRQPIAVSPARR